MTNSFGNLVGTERDTIPKLPVSNYAQTEPNLEEVVNKQNDANVADQERFFKSLGEIEALKSKNFFDNLNALGGLVKEVGEYKRVSEANKEAKRLFDVSNNLFKTKQAELLEFNEKKADMTEAEIDEELRKLAGNDDQAYELLRIRYLPNQESLKTKEFTREYNDNATAGFDNLIKKNGLFNLPTLAQANGSADEAINIVLTKYLLDAQDKGLNINDRALRRYFNKELYPALVNKKKEALRTWNQFSIQNYKQNVKREVDSKIIATFNSKTEGAYDGVFDNEDVGLIQEVQKIMGLSKKDALNYIIERAYDLRYQIESGGVDHFLNTAEFAHSGKKDPKGKPLINKGYINSGIGSQGEIDGNAGYLTRIQSEIALSDQKVYTTVVRNYEEKVRELRKLNLGDEDFKISLAELEADFRKDLKAKGLASDLPLPNAFLTDETSGIGNESYSEQINNRSRVLDIVNFKKDYTNALRNANRNPNYELTSTQLNLEVKAAEFELVKNVNALLKKDSSLTLAEAVTSESKKILAKLVAGDYSVEVDKTRPTLPIDMERDKNYIKTNGVNSVMNQKEFVSLDEKRGLDQLFDYYESGFDPAKFPQYFNAVVKGTNVTAHEYAIARYKAMFPGDASNMKNPEEFFDLSDEEKRKLYLRKNQTANLELLNGDDDVTIETKMLGILQKRNDVNYFRDPNKFFKKQSSKNMTVQQLYDLANKGATDFGLYNISAEEFIEIVDAGGINKEGLFDEAMQAQFVFGLMRIQANKSNDIMGALIEADKDWRFLTNLSDIERTQVLQFFPNLRFMPNNQFQNLQRDISLHVLEKKGQIPETLINNYVDNTTPIELVPFPKV